MRGLLLMVLVGCDVPLLNEPPYLVSVNGVGAGGGPNGRQANTMQYVPVSLPPPSSDVLELVVVAEDPEGDPFEIWFPVSVGTVDFDPSGTTGRWVLPGPDLLGREPPLSLNLVLREPDRPDAATWYVLTFEDAPPGGGDAPP